MIRLSFKLVLFELLYFFIIFNKYQIISEKRLYVEIRKVRMELFHSNSSFFIREKSQNPKEWTDPIFGIHLSLIVFTPYKIHSIWLKTGTGRKIKKATFERIELVFTYLVPSFTLFVPIVCKWKKHAYVITRG